MSLGVSSAGRIRRRLGLTARGWWFLGTGLLLTATGLSTGWVAALQLGALVAVLPLGAALLTPNPGPGLELQRVLSSRELACGEVLKVAVSARGSLPRGRTLLIEDLAPPELAGPHRLAVTGAPGQGLSRSHYRVQAGARGIHHIGPMRLHVIDSFGMVHRVIPAGTRDEVTVHPRVAELDPRILGSEPMGIGSGHLGARGSATDDVIPRDYHAGDEVRRIDWKASARTGNLMVRSEETPWRSAVTVVVDLRQSEHRGRAPDSSVDAALSMAASIGCLVLAGGWDLTVRSTDDELLFDGSPVTGMTLERRQLLLALATAPVSRATVPSHSLSYSTQSGGAGPLILIVAQLTVATARLLTGIGAQSTTRILVDIDSAQWADDRRVPRTPPAAQEAEVALTMFRQAGWRSTHLGRTGTGVRELTAAVARAWAELGARR